MGGRLGRRQQILRLEKLFDKTAFKISAL